MTVIRAVLANPYTVVLVGLRALLESDRDVQVVATAVSADETFAAVGEHEADILFVERAMPGTGGLDIIRRLHDTGRAVRSVLMGSVLEAEDIAAALEAGARGALVWDKAASDAVRCLRVVANGGIWLDGDAPTDRIRLLLAEHGGRGRGNSLTRRESELAALVANGLRNAQIAERLHISEGTVKIHLNRIYRKLGTPSRVALALYLRDHA
jgi:DNA-binding NarL/FixJ family response regulator